MTEIAGDDLRLSENIFVDPLQNITGLAHQFIGSMDVSGRNALNRKLVCFQTKGLNDILRAYHNALG